MKFSPCCFKNVLFTLFVFLCTCVLPKISVGQVQIDSVKPSISTCSNNGAIKVFAKTATGSLLYAITNGPLTLPVQTSNVFSSLPPGTYTIEVSNTANQKQTTPAIITGNYELPDFTPEVINPDCPANNTGVIIGSPTLATGLSPFTWELITPSEVTRPNQGIDTFKNLPQGTYNLRMTDACNNIQTKSIILFTSVATLTYSGASSKIIGCDTTSLILYLNVSDTRSPYTVSYNAGGKSYTLDTSILSNVPGPGYLQLSLLGPNVTYGGAFTNITVTDHCGTSVNIPEVDVCPFKFWPIYTPLAADNCKAGLFTSFGLGDQFTCSDVNPKLPFTFTIKDAATGNIVQMKTLNAPEDGSFTSVVMEPSKTYTITIKDGCNHTYTDAVTTPAMIRSVDHSFNSQPMLDSTVNCFVNAHGYPTKGTILTILDGPVSAHSSKKGYVYNEDYIYPKTFTGQVSSDSTMSYGLANMAPGKYHFSIVDSCGNVFLDSIIVTVNDIISYNYQYNYTKGCAGESGLQYQFSFNALDGGSIVSTITDIKKDKIIYTRYGSNLFTYSGVINNLKAADYGMEIIYPGYRKAASMNNILVDTFFSRDTIHITPYQNPALQSSSTTTCNGHLFLTLLADSSKGIPPYQYEIISGPETFPSQISNYFELTQKGTYRIRVYDKCNNSSTADVSVDAITFPPLTKIGSSCINGSAGLTYGASPYFSYTWTKPDGSSFTIDTLLIAPVTKTDTGTYTITRVTTINGCTNTDKTSYHLSLGTVDSTAAMICKNQTYLFGNKNLNQTGIYRDTFLTASCDSVSILNLTVQDYIIDSNDATICTKQTYSFRNKTLTQAGIYRDTVISTNSCDSIFILNLSETPAEEIVPPKPLIKNICAGDSIFSSGKRYYQSGIYKDTIALPDICSVIIFTLDVRVDAYKKDSAVKNICTGQSFTFGTHTYNTTGIYRDTIPTSTCDSISILNLTVNNYKKDSTVQSICAGQSFVFGIHPYNTTGIYRDTIPTSTCDSISILNLTVNNYKKDSTTQAICAGQSFVFGTHPYNTTGIYRDTIPTSTCDSISILNLTVNSYKKDSTVQSICAGQSFTFNNRTYTQTGIYRDTLTSLPCDSIAILNLTILDKPEAIITPSSTNVNKDDTIQLNVTPPAFSYLWSASNAQLNNPIIANPFAIVNGSSWIYVTTSTALGSCIALDSIFIVVNDSIPCTGSYIYMPNAFTPNADGLNDVFYIHAKNIKLHEFQIFNRWGEMVFRTADIKDGWNGRFREVITAGSYVYWISYFPNCDNKARLLKGNVILVR